MSVRPHGHGSGLEVAVQEVNDAYLAEICRQKEALLVRSRGFIRASSAAVGQVQPTNQAVRPRAFHRTGSLPAPRCTSDRATQERLPPILRTSKSQTHSLAEHHPNSAPNKRVLFCKTARSRQLSTDGALLGEQEVALSCKEPKGRVMHALTRLENRDGKRHRRSKIIDELSLLDDYAVTSKHDGPSKPRELVLSMLRRVSPHCSLMTMPLPRFYYALGSKASQLKH